MVVRVMNVNQKESKNIQLSETLQRGTGKYFEAKAPEHPSAAMEVGESSSPGDHHYPSSLRILQSRARHASIHWISRWTYAKMSDPMTSRMKMYESDQRIAMIRSVCGRRDALILLIFRCRACVGVAGGVRHRIQVAGRRVV